jgi:hypothetical protein
MIKTKIKLENILYTIHKVAALLEVNRMQIQSLFQGLKICCRGEIACLLNLKNTHTQLVPNSLICLRIQTRLYVFEYKLAYICLRINKRKYIYAYIYIKKRALHFQVDRKEQPNSDCV